MRHGYVRLRVCVCGVHSFVSAGPGRTTERKTITTSATKPPTATQQANKHTYNQPQQQQQQHCPQNTPAAAVLLFVFVGLFCSFFCFLFVFQEEASPDRCSSSGGNARAGWARCSDACCRRRRRQTTKNWPRKPRLLAGLQRQRRRRWPPRNSIFILFCKFDLAAFFVIRPCRARGPPPSSAGPLIATHFSQPPLALFVLWKRTRNRSFCLPACTPAQLFPAPKGKEVFWSDRVLRGFAWCACVRTCSRVVAFSHGSNLLPRNCQQTNQLVDNSPPAVHTGGIKPNTKVKQRCRC
jgi:hypothetical protein